MRVHKISNVNKALDFIASKGVKLVSIGAEGKATSWLSDLSVSKLYLPLPFSHICISVPFVPPWPYHVYFSIETEQLLVFSLLQSLWERTLIVVGRAMGQSQGQSPAQVKDPRDFSPQGFQASCTPWNRGYSGWWARVLLCRQLRAAPGDEHANCTAESCAGFLSS